MIPESSDVKEYLLVRNTEIENICDGRGSTLFCCAATVTANEGAKSTNVFKLIVIIASQTLFCFVNYNGCIFLSSTPAFFNYFTSVL